LRCAVRPVGRGLDEAVEHRASLVGPAQLGEQLGGPQVDDQPLGVAVSAWR